jgi:hypothetical protein
MKKFFAGMVVMVLVIVLIVGGWGLAGQKERGIVIGLLAGLVGLLIGAMGAMSVVGVLLLMKLVWSVDSSPGRAPQPVIIHGLGQPPSPPGQAALPPPQGWRPQRTWNVLGQPEEVTEVQQMRPGEWG